MTRINYGGMGVGQKPSRDREGMGGTPGRGPWVGALGVCPEESVLAARLRLEMRARTSTGGRGPSFADTEAGGSKPEAG